MSFRVTINLDMYDRPTEAIGFDLPGNVYTIHHPEWRELDESQVIDHIKRQSIGNFTYEEFKEHKHNLLLIEMENYSSFWFEGEEVKFKE